MLLECTLDDGAAITVPGIVPRMTEAPGRVEWLGRVPLGADNDAVYGELLGVDASEMERLREAGII